MNDTYYIDRDTRPKTQPCNKCGRDVESGKKCECAPTQRIVTATVRKP